MKCNSCGYDNVSGSLFCVNCGKPLTIVQNNNSTVNSQSSNQEVLESKQNNLEMYNMEKEEMIDTSVEEAVNNPSHMVNNVTQLTDNVNTINSNTAQSNNQENVTKDTITQPINSTVSMDNNITQPVSNQNAINNNIIQPNNSESSITNSFDSTNSSQNQSNGNKKNKIVIFSIVGIILLILIVALCLVLLNPSPKRIFSGFTNKLYSSFEKSLVSDYNSIYMNMELEPKVSGTESKELEDIVNKFSMNLSGGIDYKNKAFIYNLNTNYNKKELLNINAQYDKDFYLEFANLYDKPIKVKESDLSSIFEKSDTKDAKIVLKGYVEALNKSLKDRYFSSKNKEITYDGNKINTKVTELKINDDNIDEISKSMKQNLINNEEFLASYAKINDIEKSEAKENISQSFEDMYGNLEIDLYTKGITNEFVKLVITSDETKIEFGSKKSNDNYYVKIENDGVAISIDYKYSYECNKKIELNDVSNAVDAEEASTELLESFNNITKQEGYIELDKDIENATGYSIDELITSLMNFNSLDNNYYDYDSSYDYEY